MRNKITALIRSATYFATLKVSDTRQFWKAYKAFHKQFNSVPNLVHDGIEANTNIEKADLLNQFFSTCWNTEVPPLIYGTEDHSISCPDELLCSEEEVLHFLMQLHVDTTVVYLHFHSLYYLFPNVLCMYVVLRLCHV